jgi:hypothetical protein
VRRHLPVSCYCAASQHCSAPPTWPIRQRSHLGMTLVFTANGLGPGLQRPVWYQSVFLAARL